MPIINCPYCKGRGTDPFFGTKGAPVKCIVCLGRKVVDAPDDAVTCPHCNGTAKHQWYRMPCHYCGGKGKVAKTKAAGYKPIKDIQ